MRLEDHSFDGIGEVQLDEHVPARSCGYQVVSGYT